MSDYIELTIKNPDGDVKTRKVKGLFFVAQNISDDNSSYAGVVGKPIDLLKTFMVVPKILKKNTEEVLKSIKDKIASALPGLPNLIKPQDEITGGALVRQKIVN